MSSIYNGAPSQLVLDLIKAANPALPFALTTTNCKLAVPAAITVATGTIWDTSVRVYPLDRTVYANGITVQYRRIDLSVLFKNMVLSIEKYVTTTTLTAAQVVTELNSKYGLQLEAGDLSATTYAFGTVTVTILATSKAYKGSFSLTVAKGKQPLAEVLADGALTDTLLWPNQTAVTAGKIQGEFLLYGIDLSGDKDQLAALTSGAALAAGSALGPVLSRINRLYGTSLALTDATVAGGVLGLVATRFTIPHTSIPFANSDKFNTVIAISALSTSWFTSRILLHYNA